MTKQFLLPDLGEGLPDATIVEWYVKVGDTIRLDENLVSMETAKAVVDVPSPVSGKVLALAGNAGDIVVTGTMLAEFEVDPSLPQRAEGQDTGHHHGPSHDAPKPAATPAPAAAPAKAESADAGTWSSRVSNWDFDLTVTYTYQYGDPALGVERLYVTKNIVKGTPFANVQGYSNPQADALWAQAGVALDAGERQKLYSEVQKILVTEVAAGNLFELEFPTLYRKNVKNLVTTAIGLNESFDNVSIEKN